MALYRQAINRCCHPDCQSGRRLEVHHIFPVAQGGNDKYRNYIVLCRDCHRHSKLHRIPGEQRTQLLVYKFYIERTIIGVCSDDVSDSDYRTRLVKTKRKLSKVPEIIVRIMSKINARMVSNNTHKTSPYSPGRVELNRPTDFTIAIKYRQNDSTSYRRYHVEGGLSIRCVECYSYV